MKSVRIYAYSRPVRLVGLVMPVLLIGLIGALLLLPAFEPDLEISATRYGLILALGIPLTLIFASAIHLMYPAVHVRQDAFSLHTSLYHSRWLSWDEIAEVRLPESRLTAQICAVRVPGLPPIFRAIGLAQGMLGSAFLIHPRMPQGSELMRTLYARRPDLFPPPPKST